LNELETEVANSAGKVEQICADLDKLEEDAGNEFDKLVLQEADDLAAAQ
jgi:hypothetical protein